MASLSPQTPASPPPASRPPRRARPGTRSPQENPPPWLRPTIRIRLTVLYGGMFLIAGVVLLWIIYLLAAQAIHQGSELPFQIVAPDRPGRLRGPSDCVAKSSGGRLQPRDRHLHAAPARRGPQHPAQALPAGPDRPRGGRLRLRLRDGRAGCSRRSAGSPAPRAASSAPTCGAGSSWTARTTSSRSWPTPSTRCWTGWSAPSTPSAASSPTPRTSCAPRWRSTARCWRSSSPTRRRPPDLQQLGKTLLATNERSEQLVEGLLLLARSDNEIVDRKPVDLAEAASQALDQTRAEAQAKGVELRGTLSAAVVQGNGVLLERIALNLVQNAVRYNVAEGGWVEVTTVHRARPGAAGGGEHRAGRPGVRDRQPLRAVPAAAYRAHRQRQGRRPRACPSRARWHGRTAA